MKRLFTAILFVLFFSGCATYQAVTASPFLEASVRISVARVLENNPSLVLPTYRFTVTALELVRTQEITNLGAIDDLFFEIIKEDLLPEEQELAMMVFGSIKRAILSDLTARGVKDPSDQKLYVTQALTWINQVAAIRL